MKKMEKDILEDKDEKPKEKKGIKLYDPLGATIKNVHKNNLPFSSGLRVRRRRAPNGPKNSQITLGVFNQKSSLGSNNRLERHVTDGIYAG
jgi:hypothetical protein